MTDDFDAYSYRQSVTPEVLRGKQARQAKWAARAERNHPGQPMAGAMARKFQADIDAAKARKEAERKASVLASRKGEGRKALRKVYDRESSYGDAVSVSEWLDPVRYGTNPYEGAEFKVIANDEGRVWYRRKGDKEWVDLGYTTDEGQSWGNTLAEAEEQRERHSRTSGRLYWAPLGESKDGPNRWVDIGYTSEGFSYSRDAAVDQTDWGMGAFKIGKPGAGKSAPAYNFPIQSQSVSFDFKADTVTIANLDKAFNGALLKSTDVLTEKEITDMLNDYTANPADLEESAARIVAMAADLRKLDSLEPQGDEPTISFEHKFSDAEDAKRYTHVAFKANGESGSDRWYVTGQSACREGLSWRELARKFPAVARGEFLTVAKWV